MHEAVKAAPGLAEFFNDRSDVLVAADIHAIDELTVKVSGQPLDALAIAFVGIGEGELGALAAAGLGNAVRNRAVGDHASDQKLLAVQKSHNQSHFFRAVRSSRGTDDGVQASFPARLPSRNGSARPPLRWVGRSVLAYGSLMRCPTLNLLERRPLRSFRIRTEVPKRLAMLESVSPDFTR